MDSSVQAVPITPAELKEFLERANRLLVSVKWTAKPWTGAAASLAAGPQQVPGTIAWRETSVEQAVQEELSLLSASRALGKDLVLLPAAVNHALTVVRQGLTIGMHLSKAYTKFSGLDQLVALNGKGGLAELQKVEFRNKYQTASAVAIFSTAYYILWELSQYRRDELASVKLEVGALPEVFLQDPVRSLECFTYYLTAFIQKSGLVRTELELVKATMLFAEAHVTEIRRRAESLEHIDSFTAQSYKLENSEFRITGFTAELAGQFQSTEFNRVRLDEIVGNREAKHQARRLAGRLLCYDPVMKKNPIQELGGLSTISMGFGEPGTGKSLLISALATMLDDYCRELGIPFLFWPMPDTVVSTYQGGSAERMMSWMMALKDPTKIIYAPIDDAENNLEDRARQGVSAGVREVIAVFLRNTEGAYAVHRGNAVIQLFTNLPDQIDKAVMSRINERAYIGGATTREDFLDQDFLWYRKYMTLVEGFVNQTPPRDYEFLSAQVNLRSLSETAGKLERPTEERVAALFERISAAEKPGQHDFFARLFVAVKKEFPFFTSRDIRNIQRAIDARVLDFDFPENWFHDPELFFRKDYQTKKGMLVEQMKHNMGNLSFADVRREETVRYLDAMAAIAESGRERRISQIVEEQELHEAARKRFLEAKK